MMRVVAANVLSLLIIAAAIAPTQARADSPEGPSIIFFDWDSVRIEPEAAVILDGVVARFGRIVAIGMVIQGATDRSGSDAYNRGLSLRRAEVVRDYLVSRGVPVKAVGVQANGEARPLVETDDGVKEAQNRYALISYTVE